MFKNYKKHRHSLYITRVYIVHEIFHKSLFFIKIKKPLSFDIPYEILLNFHKQTVITKSNSVSIQMYKLLPPTSAILIQNLFPHVAEVK